MTNSVFSCSNIKTKSMEPQSGPLSMCPACPVGNADMCVLLNSLFDLFHCLSFYILVLKCYIIRKYIGKLIFFNSFVWRQQWTSGGALLLNENLGDTGVCLSVNSTALPLTAYGVFYFGLVCLIMRMHCLVHEFVPPQCVHLSLRVCVCVCV